MGIFTYDLDKQTDQFLVLGQLPTVSMDGNHILIYDQHFQPWLIDLKLKTTTKVDWPGRIGANYILALIDANRILYGGYSTEGTQVSNLKYGSPLYGSNRPALSLKIANFITGEFQTVDNKFDYRDHWSFGDAQSES